MHELPLMYFWCLDAVLISSLVIIITYPPPIYIIVDMLNGFYRFIWQDSRAVGKIMCDFRPQHRQRARSPNSQKTKKVSTCVCMYVFVDYKIILVLFWPLSTSQICDVDKGINIIWEIYSLFKIKNNKIFFHLHI